MADEHVASIDIGTNSVLLLIGKLCKVGETEWYVDRLSKSTILNCLTKINSLRLLEYYS